MCQKEAQMNTNIQKTLFVLIAAALVLAACGAPATPPPTATPTATPAPASTVTPLPLAGCNAVMADGVLYFDEEHEGKPYVIAEHDPYVYQPEFFAYYRAECVEGYPRVVMGIADVNCLNRQVKWETDAGWSCWMPDGSWVFVAGGLYIWPRGKPVGYEDPRPIVPDIPLPPEQPAEENNEQHG